MKKTVFAMALVATTTPALAGGMAEPVIEAPVIETATASSSNSAALTMATMTLAVLLAAMAD